MLINSLSGTLWIWLSKSEWLGSGDQTPFAIKYEALYLCSALVLPEERGKGLAKELIIDAVRSIQRQHPIKTLFCWSFSPEGKGLAASVAKEIGLPLRERISN